MSALPPSEGFPAGSPHPSQRLRGLKPDPSQRGHFSLSCWKHSTNSGDSCAKGATLCTSTDPPLVTVGRAPGCYQHRRGHSCFCPLLYHIYVVIYILLSYNSSSMMPIWTGSQR